MADRFIRENLASNSSNTNGFGSHKPV